MPEVAIVMSPVQPQPLPELVQALREELERQDVPCSMHAGFPEPRRGLVYLFVSAGDYVRAHGRGALPDPAILERTVLLGAEDPAALDDARLEPLRQAGAVFDINQGTVAALHRAGIPARLLRPGYVAAWDRFDPAAPRPIDVMFYGTRSVRRDAALAGAAEVLARHGCVVHLADEGPHQGDSPTWLASRRWALLAQSKLVINLHRGAERRLEWLRALDAMHSGAVLVTEHAAGLAPFAAGEHLLTASPSALGHVAEAALRDEPRLASIRVAAHERLRTWLPFSASVAVLRAAVLELVGRPLAAGMYLGSAETVSDRSDTAGASGTDVALAAVQDELVGVRRELGRLRAALASGGPAVSATPRIIQRSGAWDARRGARVTVLLVAGDDADAPIATLDSLAASRRRDFEIVVVVHEHGAANRAVRAWVSAHPRLAVVVRTETGGCPPAVARNLALALARSPACLVVEPGQTVHPRCLGELLAALDGDPAAAFVYPIRTLGDDGLADTFGWDPERPDDGPVTPPVLVRTAALRDAGGYRDRLSADPDADLWRRLAQRGLEGRIVPQILAREPLPA